MLLALPFSSSANSGREMLSPSSYPSFGMKGLVGIALGAIGPKVNQPRTYVAPNSARVYVFFVQQLNVTGAHDVYATPDDTAGWNFKTTENKLYDSTRKESKALIKAAKQAPSAEAASAVAGYSLRITDQALTVTTEWVARHPAKSWQMKIITPDAQGFWRLEGLPSGSYEIIARGVVKTPDGVVDAEWGASIDLPILDRVQTVSMLEPKVLRTMGK
jgi:hypothetical protein